MSANDIIHVINMDQVSSLKWPPQYYFKSLTTNNYYAFLAQKDNQYAGNIMFRVKDKRLNIDKIVVIKSFRNLGIGQKLIDSAIHTGKKRNLALAQLTVSYMNAQAIDFYAKQGFLIQAIQWHYYCDGEHGLKMYRKI
jgi:ribosomal protein S18 acetylase RimI-like enzyme